MATDTRPGFRLPWAAAPGEAEDQPAVDNAEVTEETQTTDMIETTDTVDSAAPSAAPRRATKFMAELSRAMQVAAENARIETMARFEIDAKGVVEEVHAKATEEAADLRRKADDDVASIREWSKAEIAHIREETDTRIAARKTGLDGEVEQHAATVEARAERVTAVVASFEAQMAEFFVRLNAEQDPTRIATMAETMPDPPSLAEVAYSLGVAPVWIGVEPTADPETETPEAEAPADTDFAAAEAEAEATLSSDLEGEDAELAMAEAEPLEAAADAAADEDQAPSVEVPAAPVDHEPTASVEHSSRRLIVSGLVSVANIANFKRGLTRTAGVSTIAVASGPDGDFIFTVNNTLGAALAASIEALPGFDIQITDESDDAIKVAAQDRDATD